MKSRAKVAVLAALGSACAPVVASATVLFQDDFNAGTSGTRYTAYGQDVDAGAETPGAFAESGGVPTPGAYDVGMNFNFNYGAYTYFYTSADFSNPNLSAPIPQAPRSGVGAPSIGLRLDANQIDDTNPEGVVVSLYPKLSQYLGSQLPSGNHKLTVDVWMNYTGPWEGNAGSMEFFTAGVNQAGTGVGGLVISGDPNNAGYSLAINGERTNGLDYRFYRNNTRFGELDVRAGYVALDQGPAAPGPSDGTNPFYQGVLGDSQSGAFPYVNPNNANEPWYETAGGVGKHWNTFEIVVEDDIVYHYVTPQGGSRILLSARTDETVTSGHIMMGYADIATNPAALETRNTDPAHPDYDPKDANFGIFDNVVVETITQTRQKWQVAGTANWSNPNAWQNADVADGVTEVADFTTFLPASQFVTMDSPRTVRSLTFDSGSPNGYSIIGANTLTLDSLTSGIRGKVKVVTGSHEITAPLILKKPTTIDVAAGSQIKISNLQMSIDPLTVFLPDPYTADPDALTKRGDGLAEANVVRVPTGLTITGGTLKITPNGGLGSVSTSRALTISGTGKLDLTNNKLVTGRALGTWGGSAYTEVSGLVDTGRGNSSNAQWDGVGIVTSDTRAVNNNDLVSIGTASVAALKNIAATDTSTFAGQTVLGSDTIAMVTWGGDANLDGKINIDDYGQIDFNVSSSGSVFGWFNGDFNYDGKINIDDYGIIDFNVTAQNSIFPTGGGVEGAAAVPEPASVGVIALAGLAAAGRRRRQRVG